MIYIKKKKINLPPVSVVKLIGYDAPSKDQQAVLLGQACHTPLR